MLRISKSATEKLSELIVERRRKFLASKELTLINSGGFNLHYSKEQVDNKRGPNGENIFFVVEKAHWRLTIFPEYDSQFSHMITEINGLIFMGIDMLETYLDYDGLQFTADGEPVRLRT